MYSIVLGIHYLLCFFLIGVVLLQQGRGADVGAALGGGSNTLFGASGASSVLSKITVVSAILFMVTSILLVKHYPTNFLGTGSADVLQGSVVDTVAPVSVPLSAPSTTTESPATNSDASTASAVVVPPSQANGATTAPQAAVAPVVGEKAVEGKTTEQIVGSTSEEKK